MKAQYFIVPLIVASFQLSRAQITTSEIKTEDTGGITTISGSLGIGVTQPLYKFELDGTFNVDVGNSAEITLFEHTGPSSPVPFNLRKSGYNGNNVSYGILHLDMAHSNEGGGANLHYRLLNTSGTYKEYGGLGAFIIDNTAGSEDGALTFYTTYDGQARIRRMTILNNGNIGIGVTQPSYKFELDGTFNVDVGNSAEITLFEHTGPSSPVPFNLRKSGYNGNNVSYGILHLDMAHSNEGGGANLHYRLLNTSGTYKEYGGLGAFIIDNTAGSEDGALTFYTTYDGQARIRRMTILNNGSVGIGTTNPNPAYKLDVNGSVNANSMHNDGQEVWSDFVFKKGYKLPPLIEVEQHIKKFGHLQHIPSEEEVLENGYDMGTMDAKLLQKIEELTLYLIEQNKQNEVQRQQIQLLQKQVNTLKQQVKNK